MWTYIAVGVAGYIAGGVVTLGIIAHTMAASQADTAAEDQMRRDQEHEE